MGVCDECEELVLGQRDGQGLVRELVGEMYGRCRGDLGETWGIFWGHVGRSREMYISRLYLAYISPTSRLHLPYVSPIGARGAGVQRRAGQRAGLGWG